MADRDQHVLEPVAPGDVVVDVAGGDVAHPDVLRELDQARDPAGIAVDEVVLQLDEDLVGPEPVDVPPQDLLRQRRSCPSSSSWRSSPAGNRSAG